MEHSQKPSLLVLAAGLGSRYGSLKQLDQFGPNDETIIDYSIFDAQRLGFGKVVFVIRKSIEKYFRAFCNNRSYIKIRVEFVFQELGNIPESVPFPSGREKPWGTGHAVLMAASVINTPFAVINADDFYGYNSFRLLYEQICRFEKDKVHACLIGYQLDKSLSDHGSVSRGICELYAKSNLKSITERTNISKNSNGSIQYAEGDGKYVISGDEIISMNLFGFSPLFFDVLKNGFTQFLKSTDNILNDEYYLPKAVDILLNEKGIKIPVITTPDETFGVTYKEDREVVKAKLAKLIRDGVYPKKLS